VQDGWKGVVTGRRDKKSNMMTRRRTKRGRCKNNGGQNAGQLKTAAIQRQGYNDEDRAMLTELPPTSLCGPFILRPGSNKEEKKDI
jgi:hypothetical protein